MTNLNNTDPETAIPVDPNQKAVSNPATQTLFRFVSMRNPQLAKKEGNLKFIFRKDNNKGIFDTLINGENGWTAASGKSKMDYLIEKVKSISFDLTKVYRTQEAIKDKLINLFTASKNLMENGEISLSDINIVQNTSLEDKKKLWDSLIYQVLIQEDFYVKELLTQMLQTIHYAENYDSFSTESDAVKKQKKQKEITTAKAVIPDYLLIDSATDNGEETASAKYFTIEGSEVGSEDYISEDYSDQSLKGSEQLSYQASFEMVKRQKVAFATYKKQQLESLKKEVLKNQKFYRKDYQKNYDVAYKKYQTEVGPILEMYQQNLLEAEAGLDERSNAASRKLALSKVEKPNISDFEFNFETEREFLKKKLSEVSLISLSNLLGKVVKSEEASTQKAETNIQEEEKEKLESREQVVFPEDEYQNFDEILELVDEKLAEANEEIYNNTEVEKQQYASVGGVLIPVNKSVSVMPFTYQICAVKNVNTVDKYNFDLQLNMPSSGWDISYIYYDLGGNTNGYYEKIIIGDTIYLKNFYNSTSNIYGIEASRFPIALEVHLFFTNGKTSVFNTGAMQPGTCVSGVFSVEGGTDNPGDSTTPVSTNNSFVPKGFGIKRLGIADYLKVEQTTHAYVEGEVANIENIMAREYRSQSTRRLSRKETTDSSSSDIERERSTDTTTSSRFEMQSEISKILQEATDMGINANTSYSNNTRFGNFSAQLGASYANHRSKEDSMRQAVTQAQEVTARALDRVVTKVHQERVEKMIEEFEENNTHGFDNRKGNQHVVGVYRWVDKLMKNQVWNYGKRMMFEFAIPQPSKLHTLAAASVKKIIEKPIDPRKATNFNLSDYTKISDDTIKYWTGAYNVEIGERPEATKFIDHTFSKDNVNPKTEGRTTGLGGYASNSTDFKIPEGYEVEIVTGAYSGREIGESYQHPGVSVIISGKDALNSDNSFNQAVARAGNKLKVEFSTDKPKEKISISVSTWDEMAFTVNVLAKCVLSDQAKQQYQQKTFNAIIEAYEDALADYNNKISEEDAKASNIKDGNPMFYRQIEQEVLKHNSIAYLVDDSVSKNNKVLGKSLYTGDTVAGFEITRTGLDDYASLAKFMEQAFEWDIMSYNYYPYYWGKREDWDDMYQSENIDPLFRSFLRSGMARVVVTVRPGFEDAVQFYMSTGRLWNGGEVPVIGDPMYLSLVDEMKDVKGETQGKPWITRLPTSLTILQAESIGLKVSSALPFTKENPALFENPEEVITISNFVKNNAMIESGTDRQVANIGLDEDSMLLTTDDDQIVSELPLEDLKKALE